MNNWDHSEYSFLCFVFSFSKLLSWYVVNLKKLPIGYHQPHQMLTYIWTNVKCIYVPYAYNSYMALEPNHIYKLHTTNKATVNLKK